MALHWSDPMYNGVHCPKCGWPDGGVPCDDCQDHALRAGLDRDCPQCGGLAFSAEGGVWLCISCGHREPKARPITRYERQEIEGMDRDAEYTEWRIHADRGTVPHTHHMMEWGGGITV